MTEILLTLIILAMIGYHVYFVIEVNKKEHKYVQALLARNLTELAEVEVKEIKANTPETPKDTFLPMDSLSDDEFNKVLFDKK